MSLPPTLLTAFDAARTEPSGENFNRLMIELEKGQYDVFATDDVQDEADLVLLWSRTCVMYTHYSPKRGIDDYTTNAIGIILTTDGVIERILKNTADWDALAYLALSAVANKKAGDARWAHQGILKMLSAWTGEPVVDDETLSVEVITTKLYGPMVYALYRSDVDEDKFLPAWLCIQNVAVQGTSLSANENQRLSVTPIPNDIYADDARKP